MTQSPIILENSSFRLEIGPDCIAKSLVIKATGEECLKQGENISLFSVTQERPFNNEMKLAHPNKRTTFQQTACAWRAISSSSALRSRRLKP